MKTRLERDSDRVRERAADAIFSLEVMGHEQTGKASSPSLSLFLSLARSHAIYDGLGVCIFIDP